MAFVRACPATHAGIHKNLEGTKFFQPFTEPVHYDILPVVRQLPVIVFYPPVAGVGHAQGLDILGTGSMAEYPLPEHGRCIHPPGLRHCQIYLREFFGLGEIVGHGLNPFLAKTRGPCPAGYPLQPFCHGIPLQTHHRYEI